MPKNQFIDSIKSFFPVWTKDLSKELISFSKMATLTEPAEIDFFMVGVMKSGTTSLYNYMIENPYIFPPLYKEIHYFDDRPHRSMSWYRSNFISKRQKESISKKAGKKIATGEATPTYIFRRSIAEKIKKSFPDTRIIILLRNPVGRAYSEFNFIKRFYNIEEDFLSYASREIDWIQQQSFRHVEEIYQVYSKEPTLLRGVYHWFVKDYYDVFGRDKVMVINADDFFKNTDAVYRRTLNFLDIEYVELPKYEKYDQGNKYDKMSEEARKLVGDFYAPHNQALFDLIGEAYKW
jgi:hypothetical protein